MASTTENDRSSFLGAQSLYRWIVIVLAVVFCQLPSYGQISLKPRSSTGGSSHRADRKEALAAIPFAQLTPEAAQKIRAVVTKPSVYRRMPVKAIECDAQLYTFLIRNPEVVVDIWKLMGVTQLEIQRTGQYSFSSSDGAGTDSTIQLVYGTPQTHIFYGTGVYEGSLFKNRIEGNCVLVLQTEFRNSGGKPVATSRLDMFMQINQNAIEVFAKTFQPLLGKAADMNFVETANFLEKLSQTAAVNGQGMIHMSNKLTNVSEPVRNQFGKVASTVGDRNPVIQRRAALPRPVRPAAAEQPAGIRPRSTRRISGYRDTYYR
jgi:hypothetical protein